MKLLKANCLVCKSKHGRTVFSSFDTHGREIVNGREKFDVLQCGNCDTFFLNTKIDSHYYKKYYKENYYKDYSDRLAHLLSILLGFFSSYRKQQYIVSKFPKNLKIRLLDMGCGTGNFLKSLSEIKFQRFGIEINPIGAELCRKNGLRVYNENIFVKDFGKEKFDVVTLWHVLEHLNNPTELFTKAHTILNKDGLLIFQVPNSDSLGFKIGKKYWFHLDSPRHLWIPSRKSIEFLCNMGGFNIVEIKNEFYDYPLDLFWSVRKSRIRFIIYPLYPFIKLFSGEHLTFICKKK